MTNHSTVHRSTIPPILVITGVVFGFLGTILAGGGLWLVTLGDSAYYLFGGLGILATGALLVAGRRSAFWLYAAVLMAAGRTRRHHLSAGPLVADALDNPQPF